MMTNHHSKDSYYPTKIAGVPIADFTKEQLLVLLTASVLALNYDDSIYGGLLGNRKLFEPEFLTLLRDIEGYHRIVNVIRIIAGRLAFIE